MNRFRLLSVFKVKVDALIYTENQIKFILVLLCMLVSSFGILN